MYHKNNISGRDFAVSANHEGFMSLRSLVPTGVLKQALAFVRGWDMRGVG